MYEGKLIVMETKELKATDSAKKSKVIGPDGTIMTWEEYLEWRESERG